MVDDLNQVLIHQHTASESQHHANMVEEAKRAGQHSQSSTKPPSQAWYRQYSIGRIAIAAIGLLAMAGFAVWVVLSSG